ncbi:MAG: MFS transporter, partial [Candidatus Bathyarchaeia archaeon]
VIFISTLKGLFAAPMGLVSGLFYVSALKPEVRARFMSTYNSIGWLGATVGALLAGYMVDMFGYKVPFLIFAALNVLCAFLILNFAEVENVDSSISLKELYKEGFAGVKTAYLSLPTWLREEKEYTAYCIGIAVRGLGLALTGPIFTIHLKQNLNASSTQIGELSALSSIVRMATLPVLGWVADYRSRKQVFLGGVFLAMLHPILFVTRTNVSQLYPVYVMNGLFWACIESVWFAWQMDIIPERRGIYMAILSFFNGTEWAIGPLIGSFLGETFGFFPASIVAAAAIGLGFWRLTKVPEHARKRGCS